MTVTNSLTLSAHTIRRLSVESMRDPRSVLRVVAGRPVRSVVEQSVRDAAARLGIVLPEPASSVVEREHAEGAMHTARAADVVAARRR